MIKYIQSKPHQKDKIMWSNSLLVEYLLSKGADPNQPQKGAHLTSRDNMGIDDAIPITPLNMAIDKGNLEIVNILIRAGAEINVESKKFAQFKLRREAGEVLRPFTRFTAERDDIMLALIQAESAAASSSSSSRSSRSSSSSEQVWKELWGQLEQQGWTMEVRTRALGGKDKYYHAPDGKRYRSRVKVARSVGLIYSRKSNTP